MITLTMNQARARISKLRQQLAHETDPERCASIERHIRQLNKAGGMAEARSTYKAKLAEMSRSMMGAY